MEKIKLDSKKKTALVVLALVLVITAGLLLFLNASSGVAVDTVTREDIYRSIMDTGRVTSENSLNLQAPGNGKILSIPTSIGSRVKTGDLLVVLDDSALGYELKSLEYQIKSLESNIAYLSDPYDDLALENYEGSVRIAYENYLSAREDYEKARSLFELGGISLSELTSLELESTVSEMNYSMALNESKAASQGGDTDVVGQYRFQLESLTARLEALKKNMEDYEVKAPFDGIVGDIYVKEGEFAAALVPLVQVYEEKYYIEAQPLEENLVLMETGAAVEIFLESAVIEGSIRRIHPTIQRVISDLGIAQQRGIVEIQTNHEFSLVGREVDLNFRLYPRQAVLTVDKETLVRRGDKDCVFVVVDDRAQLTEVMVGARGNQRYEIIEGLKEGDTLILSPGDDLEDGEKVSY